MKNFKHKYPLTIERLVLRNYLDNLSIYDLWDIIPKLLTNSDKQEIIYFISNRISRTAEKVKILNFLADEIGAEEYTKKV